MRSDRSAALAAASPTIREAIAAGTIGERLWFYTNYHCNLACLYCLTSSSPRSARRELDARAIDAAAAEAVALGFRSFGITGGEPFVREDAPALVTRLAARLPVVVLTNGTLFTERFVERLRDFAALPIALQVSIDGADPARNDASRGAGTHARVIDGVRRLRSRGIRVRIGSTTDGSDPADLRALCAIHRDLGIGDDDHIVRPIVRRGRATERRLGVEALLEDVPAELTITADGAFWSPASPTVTDGRLDTSELLTRTIAPLRVAAEAMVGFAAGAVGPQTGRVT